MNIGDKYRALKAAINFAKENYQMEIAEVTDRLEKLGVEHTLYALEYGRREEMKRIIEILERWEK